jgi:hypothetical protein
MGVLNEAKSGVTNPSPMSGGILKVIISIVVVVGVVLAALVFWGKVSTKNIPVVSQAVSPARVYIS